MAETKTFGQAANQVLDAAASQEQSRKGSARSSHEVHFLKTFQRWEILFKRKDNGDVESDKWLIAEYYDSLKHLSERGLDVLTALLKENHVFFPTIKECLDLTKPAGPYDWGHAFHKAPALFVEPERPMLVGETRTIRIGYDD